MIVSVAKSKETPRDEYYNAQNKMKFKIELEKIKDSNNKNDNSKEDKNLITKLEKKYNLKHDEVSEALDTLKEQVNRTYNKLSFKDKCMVFCNNHKKEIAVAAVTTFTIVGIVVGVKTGNINLRTTHTKQTGKSGGN
jgi:hypothetical protein